MQPTWSEPEPTSLAMVGFLLGEEFISKKEQHRKAVIGLSSAVFVATTLLVFLLFSILLTSAEAAAGNSAAAEVILHPLWELCGAVVLGVAAGVPMAWLTGRLRGGEPAALEALGAGPRKRSDLLLFPYRHRSRLRFV